MAAIIKAAADGVSNYLGGGNQDDTYYDPLEIITIARLAFMPTNTKIRFHRNNLELQQSGISQTVSRTINYESHKHLDRLTTIIKSVLKFYKPCQDQVIQDIFYYAIKGLGKLKDTYHDKEGVEGNIDHMISLISVNVPNVLEKRSEEAPTAKGKEAKTATFKKNETSPDYVKEEDCPESLAKIREIWHQKDLEDVVAWLKEAERLQGTYSIDVEVKGKDKIEFIETLQAHKHKRFISVIKKEVTLPT